MKGVYGKIHSCESFGAVDGPGVRFVVFFQGCALRCLYCHNPDTWDVLGGNTANSRTLVKEIEGYRSFIKNGGVTLSGGEPLLQPEFAIDILRRCKAKGIHTAVDTAGFAPKDDAFAVTREADLILLDIKAFEDKKSKQLCGGKSAAAKSLLEYCESIAKPVWLRHVLLPEYTLEKNSLEALAKYVSGFKCIERVELLPYHSLGAYKWDEMGLNYSLKNTPEPTSEEIQEAISVFRNKGLICQ